MLINEILRVKGSRLLSIAADGRAVDAVRTMAEENLGSLVVMEGSRMLGMLIRGPVEAGIRAILVNGRPGELAGWVADAG